jgi:hypothetical protein
MREIVLASGSAGGIGSAGDLAGAGSDNNGNG